MGTKGRNLFIWLFSLSALAAMIGRYNNLPIFFIFAWLNILTGLSILYFYYQAHMATKRSREMGLKYVVLLPIFYKWAEILIRLTGKKIKNRGFKAYEVHVRAPKDLNLVEFVKYIDNDLNLARKKLPNTLFIWETSAPLPSSIRYLIKKQQKKGTAFWEKGRWPIPPVPFMERELKRGTVRRGAILATKEREAR